MQAWQTASVIIARSPLRISLGGGGTDIPSYYSEEGGFVISAAINKYVYVTVSRPFAKGIFLKYSEIENINEVDEVKHPIIREVLRKMNLNSPQIEIATHADVPSGTGLGSSGSFTTALIKAIYAHYRKSIQTNELAKLACEIEIDILKEPIGKQDQFIASYGGISEFNFLPNGKVQYSPLNISMNTLHDLEDNLLLFFTGISRSAGTILKDQVNKTQARDLDMKSNLNHIKELGIRSKSALLEGDTILFAQIMHEHWMRKRKRSASITNDFINEIYDKGIEAGALGGKLVGAGGGGFLMFYCRDKEKLRHLMSKNELEEVRFHFDFEGSKVVLSQ